MESVTVVFRNGNIVNFVAQEFGADLTENRDLVNKYPYKNAQGQDSFIHLRPDEVVGVFLTTSPGRNEPPIAYSVAGNK